MNEPFKTAIYETRGDLAQRKWVSEAHGERERERQTTDRQTDRQIQRQRQRG